MANTFTHMASHTSRKLSSASILGHPEDRVWVGGGGSVMYFALIKDINMKYI